MRRNFRPSLPIEWVTTSSLRCDPCPLREHSDRQLKQIGRSISTFGFLVPILADECGIVIAGDARLRSAQKIGMVEVPVIRVTHLTEAEKRAFKIADNRLTENSKWNDRLLAETLRDLAALDLDFSLEVTGFSMAEIDLRIEGLSTSVGDGPDPADQLPEPSGQPPVSALDDLWQLGRHRLLCGNAMEGSSYSALMGGHLAHLVFTDPPYNVRIQGHVSRKTRRREFIMGSGELSDAEFLGFIARAFSLLIINTLPGSIHFVCMDWRHARDLLIAGTGSYDELKNICVWIKDNAGMGSLYRSQHEFVFVFKHGSAPHTNNVQLGRYGRNRTNVWHCPCANTFSRQSDEGNLAALHPTVKPVKLVADAILDCSARGDLVLDPFLGSGTTLIAAERVGRICYGMELDPLYVETAVRRWQAYTGDHAIHAATGKRFDEIAAAVELRHD
jgi:DNA modification methylase